MVKEISKDGHEFGLGLCKFVEYFQAFLRVTCDAARGLQCRKKPPKDGRGDNRLAAHSFKPTMTHVINLFTPFQVLKQKQVERNTGYIGFPYLFISSHICDGRNCELLNSMMTQICKRNRNRPSSKMQNSDELNPPEQQGVNLEGLGG